MDLIITILPVVTKDLPISPRFTPYNFLSRCKFSTLTTRQPMVEFYLLTFPRFPLRKKEHKSYFGKNRTNDFRTSRCAAYLLDHSCVRQFWPTERLVGICGPRHRVFCDVGSSPQIIRGYVSRIANSRPDIVSHPKFTSDQRKFSTSGMSYPLTVFAWVKIELKPLLT